MLTGITLVENQEFRSKHDEAPAENQTVFIIGAIDVLVRSFIQDNATAWEQTEQGMHLINKSATRNFEICRFGLKGVKNFKDSKGNDLEISFSKRNIGGKFYDVVDDNFLTKIPGIVVGELAERIIEINTASDDLRKK